LINVRECSSGSFKLASLHSQSCQDRPQELLISGSTQLQSCVPPASITGTLAAASFGSNLKKKKKKRKRKGASFTV
jgi:hypothetical protein